MQTLGKCLQVAGLVVLPVAVVMQLSGTLGRRSGVSELLLLMVGGAAAFYLGRMVEGYAR